MDVQPENHEFPTGNTCSSRDPRDGRSFSVPPSRRLSWDLLWFQKSVPLCAQDRQIDLSVLTSLRSRLVSRISWPAIFLKAFSIVARQIPELRQTWYRWPWAHIYQHASSIGTLTVSRSVDGIPWLFWGKIPQPDQHPLPVIQQCITHFQTSDPRVTFARWFQFAHLPFAVRRLVWWWNLNVCKSLRARRMGTYFLSTVAGQGVSIQFPPSIHTACVTFGPIDDHGRCGVTLAYDHRIMDGMLAATALQQLETVLLTVIAGELESLAADAGARAA